MNEQQTHSRSYRWGRIFLWGVAIILLLLAALRLSLKTAFIQDQVKQFAVSTANEQIDGQLTVDKLSGDLWKEFELINVQVDRESTIAEIDTIYAAYNILSLLGERFEISEITVSSPLLRLRQGQGEWNIQQLIKSSPDTLEQDTSGTTFPVHIEELALNGGEVYVRSEQIPVESAFAIRELSIASSLTIGEEGFGADLRDLYFQIEQTRLASPFRVESSAEADSNSITLEKLVLATGNSVIRSSAFAAQEDSSLRFSMSATPFSWKDAVQYTTDFPLRQDVQADLQISGSPEQFDLGLGMEAEGLDSLQIGGQFRWQSGLILQEFSMFAAGFDPEVLLSDTTMPAIGNMELLFTGEVPFDEYEQGAGELDFTIEEIATPGYQLDMASGNLNYNRGTAQGELLARRAEQEVSATMGVEGLWEELPAVNVGLEGRRINPAVWMQDSSMAGNINVSAELAGQGFYPDTTLWDYSMTMSDSQLMGQPIDELTLYGRAGARQATVDGFLSLGEGQININADVQGLDTVPQYSFSLLARKLNVGPLMDNQELTTGLNGRLSGEGRGTDPASMILNATATMDTSMVNEEYIEQITANITIRDSVLTIGQTDIQSSLVEGQLSGKYNILQPYNQGNDLALDLKLKDVSTLAPVFNTDTLEAEGTLSASMRPTGEEALQLDAAVDLSGVQYDIHRVEQLYGSLTLVMQEDMDYKADLELNAPNLSGIQLQDLNIFTEGTYRSPGTTEGKLGVEFSSSQEGQIEYSGTYEYAEDSMTVHSTVLNVISNRQALNLARPFDFSMQGDSIRLDTMRVASGDSTFLELAIPLFTTREQQGYLHAENIDAGAVQQALIEEPLFGGLFSGRVDMNRRDTSLVSRADVTMTDLAFNGTRFDRLRVEGDIEDERLSGTLSVHTNDTLLADAALDLPFRLENPETLPATFFDQPVKGHLTVHDISLDRFEEEFSEAGIEDTDGIVSVHSSLGGTAGHPEWAASASLREATLSGVPMDSLMLGMEYSHAESAAELNASVISMNQKAAHVNAQFPLFIDMKTFEVDLPEENDSVLVEVQTSDFNLASVNDFMDPETVADVNGRLNGKVVMDGVMKDLQSRGQLTVQDGSFQVVPAGIDVEEITSTFEFAPNEIRLTQFHAESGSGNLDARGMVELEQLVPGDMNIEVEANNFQAANTEEYNAIVNLDAQAGGNPLQPEVEGSLEIVSGFLELDNFGEKSVESIELDTTQQEDNSFSAYDSLRMEMEVSFDRRFFIRNERYLEMEIELGGQVDLVKERGGELQLFGAVETEDGYALPLGKRFDLQEGILTFSGDASNPQLNIRTQYEPPQTEEDIVIWYVIEGTVESPEFIYESQPQMELENILSYTLFGQPFYALDSWEQLVTNTGGGNSSGATGIALDVLLDRVESVATQQLGIDVVRIENTRVSGESATSVTTGWYLNPRVFFAIQNIITGASPQTGFLLEYMLRENLELIIRQGSGTREGVDIRWEYDY